MRVSTDKNDVGFTKSPYNYRIELDGVHLNNAITADDELSTVLVYTKDKDGNFLFSEEKYASLKTEMLYGKVKITKIN